MDVTFSWSLHRHSEGTFKDPTVEKGEETLVNNIPHKQLDLMADGGGSEVGSPGGVNGIAPASMLREQLLMIPEIDTPEPLATYCLSGNNPQPLLVCSMIRETGEWDWNRISSCDSSSFSRFWDDKAGWRWDTSKGFTKKTTYVALSPEWKLDRSEQWSFVWKLKVPQRIKTFLLLALHGKILTNDERQRRHLVANGNCPICHMEVEDTFHVFRRCTEAANLWRRIIKTEKLQSFMAMPHEIWKRRCMMNFQPDFNEYEDLLTQSLRLRDEIVALKEANQNDRTLRRKKADWQRPTAGWVKANTDGAVGEADRMNVAGGVIRDARREWIFGFSRSIGICSILNAELWAIYDVVLHAWDLGIKKIIVETDSALVVDLMNDPGQSNISVMVLLLIRTVINRSWEVQFVHVYCEANKVADKMVLWRGVVQLEWSCIEKFRWRWSLSW
ncbi:hypothetical protein F3Y22_tig00013960pilonHSYRG00174 [Hibiscus syriacus]|uniref:RNase H type-1 domain-containing protein n=1 Tax=Hibiscus syriacus TaxID=106335 RepID=A0A6A3C0M2_HIBSY|nr:hypothetical protein F3Y22_tig00013960pilonHSYRG00174 [Hibiscus syriacus]